MKHAGSNDDLKALTSQADLPALDSLPSWPSLRSQSLGSKLVVLAASLLLFAVLFDAPVRALSESLDPSVKATLRVVTGFGNSAWPLGIGIALLVILELLRRSPATIQKDDLTTLRSFVLLAMASVALSGFVASLTKHMIGRIRPSTEADAMVLEFSLMAFRAGWAAFPSGHATTAMAAATALALCFPRHSWALLTIGSLAALSRALIGVHWVTDCLAGMMLGAATTVFLYRTMIGRGHKLTKVPEAVSMVAAGAVNLLPILAGRWLRRLRQLIRDEDTSFRHR
jgi:membrane-associated phospholipid phosphatase